MNVSKNNEGGNMSGWWMPAGQLKILRRMATGEVLLHDRNKRIFYWESNPKERATVSAKALHNKNHISPELNFNYPAGVVKMNITPTGKNEMGYNRGIHLE
ncbi:hypothetical protein ETA_pET450330 (plasmid) [Erwinia tasmaniensis Et1/99]|uniref:Uncharacterized protein n=2 Tax=Erwinia tasmaniensis TaxID=338565 RepID=B2VB41_ERWT9|nr:hypothetical protein ETA_pET450330 [Erwinia tasmaniensis Et1/99]